ncbi:MAG: NFACT family protein [Candidatus Micrarchaeia archaeon]
MKVVLDLGKSAQENAAVYYQKAKKLREKAAGAERAVEESRRETGEVKKKPAVRRKRQWYEKFHWFISSDGFLVIGGRDAEQNEVIFSKYLESSDVFLHADVHGAPAVVVKNGSTAPERTLMEAAQFAASYSNGWKEGMASVDVYAVSKEQVSKYSHGEYVPKGGFVITGDRKWFKNVELKLYVGVSESGLECVPALCGKSRFLACAGIVPGEGEKSDLSRKLFELLLKKIEGERVNWKEEDIARFLPPGGGKVVE